MSEGASARGGAGMNDDGRGFSPLLNHAAVGTPPEETFGRERRVRFFSTFGGIAVRGGGVTMRGGGAVRAGALLGGCGRAGAGATRFAGGFDFGARREAGLGGLAGVFRFGGAATLRAGLFAALRAAGRAIFLPADFRTPTAPFFPCTFAIHPLPDGEMNGAV